MGYDDNSLRAQFRPDKIWQRQAAVALVMVAQTQERQEALVAANTAGKRFFAMGGGTHLTKDDFLMGQEIAHRKK